MSLPLTTFEGYLKSVRLDEMTDQQRFAIDFAFPNFNPEAKIPLAELLSSLPVNAAQAIHPRVKSAKQRSTDPRSAGEIVRGTPRRFSGDYTLPRERYFSICSSDGFDRGTLLSELLAYSEPDYSGPICIGECLSQSEMRDLGLESRAPFTFDSIALKLLSPPSWIQTKLRSLAIWLPTTREHHRIDGTIDLRQKKTQDWFLASFRKLESLFDSYDTLTTPEIASASNWNPPNNFAEWLPILMDPNPGGNETCDRIALRLRRRGVKALVFPSARTPVMVNYVDDVLKDSSGWNVVDYRLAPTPVVSFLPSETDPWAARYASHFGYVEQGGPIRSWAVAPPLGRNAAAATVVGAGARVWQERIAAASRDP